MRVPRHVYILSSYIFFPAFLSALIIDCSNIRVHKTSFNLDPLDGPHSVVWVQDHPPTTFETTFTIDLCKPLKKSVGVPKDEDCPNGSRVCGIERSINAFENSTQIIGAIPIAGEYLNTGENLNPKWTRLKSSPSASDRAKEGLRLEMNGAKYPQDETGKKQKAVVEFLCDAPEQSRRRWLAARDDDTKDGKDDPEARKEVDDGHGGRLKFLSYDDVLDTQVLSLEWRTKYACENSTDRGQDSGSGHWGFFTWLIIILFLAVAAYLIFGSWLNYQRHSARGCDLLPHSETIRDLPYLLRDWGRRVVNTVSGGGSRGGYSAV